MEITVELLTLLFQYRWCAPALAEVRRSNGCKYVTLRHRLGAADGPLRASLDALLGCGWLMRNPGYGHPSRPEYLVTEQGAYLAERCEATILRLQAMHAMQVGLNRWTIPTLFVLAQRPLRFTDLRAAVRPITPRALTQTLRDLITADMAVRTVTPDIPVAVEYAVTASGRTITDIWLDGPA